MQKGFSLIEVLVSLAILSIGLLGLASMQLNSQRLLQTGTQLTTAVGFASDIINQLRNFRTFVYSDAPYQYEPFVLNSSTDSQIRAYPVDCGWNFMDNTQCAAKTVLLSDLYIWRANIANALPSGTGLVCFDDEADAGATDPINHGCYHDTNSSVLDRRVVVKIWWKDNNDNWLNYTMEVKI